MHKKRIFDGLPSFLCLFNGVKASYVTDAVVVLDNGAPFSARQPMDSFNSGHGISCSGVKSVLYGGCETKVTDSVVGPVPIDVVNKFRPLSMAVEPSQTVGKEFLAVDTDLDVAISMRTAGRVAWGRLAFSAAGSDYSPCKQSRVRTVVKKFAQALCGKIGLSHDALQKLIGQRPGASANRLWASSFYGVA